MAPKKLLSVQEYAKHRGISARAVNKAIRAGRISCGPDRRIDRVTADREWAANTDTTKPRNSVTGRPKGRGPKPRVPKAVLSAAASLNQSKARKESALADLAEFRRDRERGEWIRVEQLRKLAFERARTARDRLLALTPRLKAPLAAESDPDRCGEILDQALRRVCEEMARGLDD